MDINYEDDKEPRGFVRRLQGCQQQELGGWGGVKARITWLDFLKFNSEDPISWLFKAEKFFDYHGPTGPTDDGQVWLAATHLESDAVCWFKWYNDQ